MAEVTNEDLGTLDQFADNQSSANAYDQMLKEPIPKVDRLGILFITSMLLVGISFMVFGKVDEVVSAPGVIQPEKESFRIDSTEGGVVTEVLAKTGQTLLNGQPILLLDKEEKTALVKQEFSDILLQRKKLEKLKRNYEASNSVAASPTLFGRQNLEGSLEGILLTAFVSLKKALIGLEEVQLASKQELNRTSEDSSREGSVIKERIEVLKNKRHTLVAKIKSDEENLQKRLKVLEDFRRLTQQGYYAEIELSQEEESYKAREAAIQNIKNDLADLDLAIFNEKTSLSRLGDSKKGVKDRNQRNLREAQLSVNQAITELREARSQLKTEIDVLTTQIRESEKMLALKRKGLKKTIVRMPFDGYLGELMIGNVGQVIAPGTPVAVAIRSNSQMQVITKVANRDIGFIKPGIPVKVKVDAFPHQDFGTLPAQVERIEPNVNGQDSFKVALKLEKQFIEKKGKTYNIYPGLTVTADFVTRKNPVYKLFFKTGKEKEEEKKEN